MDFRLIYQGPLASNGTAREKHAIRKALHPQLLELWKVDPHLRRWLDAGTAPAGPDIPAAIAGQKLMSRVEHIARQYNRAPFNFVPLIQEELGTACSWDILFLRREAPGGIVQGGDIDNRLKTLFDGLKTPRNLDETGKANPTDGELPFFFTLVADDSLIHGLRVETARLLEPQGMQSPTDVKLIIHVKTKIVNYENSYLDMNFQ